MVEQMICIPHQQMAVSDNALRADSRQAKKKGLRGGVMAKKEKKMFCRCFADNKAAQFNNTRDW